MATKGTKKPNVWIKVLTSYAGTEGIFTKGQTRNVSTDQLKALRKVKGFKFKSIPAPWNRNIDKKAIALDEARQKFRQAQGKVSQLREVVNGHVAKKKNLIQRLAELEEALKAKDLKKKDEARLKLELIVINSDLDAADAHIALASFDLEDALNAVNNAQSVIDELKPPKKGQQANAEQTE